VEGKPNIIGVIHSDFYGHISDANDAFLEMVGYTRNELLAGEVRWDSSRHRSIFISANGRWRY
jgi:PAS domain-containing protein